MPAVHTTLSNCYVPLPATKPPTKINPNSRPDGSTKSRSTTFINATTNTHRNSKTIRRLCIDRHILSSSTGSSLIELGHTKVLCSVHGPRPLSSSSMPNTSNSGGSGGTETGTLNCQIRYAPTFGHRPETMVMESATNLDGYGGAGTMPSSSTAATLTESQLSARLQDAITPSVPLDLLQKNVVDVFVMVLQDDGESSVWVASVMATSLALSDAGVEIYDLVSAFSVAIIPREHINLHNAKVDRLSNNGNSMDVDVDDEEIDGISKANPKYCLLADPDEDELALAYAQKHQKSKKK